MNENESAAHLAMSLIEQMGIGQRIYTPGFVAITMAAVFHQLCVCSEATEDEVRNMFIQISKLPMSAAEKTGVTH